MKGLKAVKMLSLVLAVIITAGCGTGTAEQAALQYAPPEEDRLVVYTAHKEEVYWPIIKEFEERTGIWVEIVPGGTNELLTRLAQEKDAPQADVMFGGGVDSLEAYADCFPPYFCRDWVLLDYTMRSIDGLWTPFSALPVVLIYNTKLVSPGRLTCWKDLFSPAWQGRIAFCDPSVSGSSFTGLVTLLEAAGGDLDETLRQSGWKTAGNLRSGAGRRGGRNGSCGHYAGGNRFEAGGRGSRDRAGLSQRRDQLRAGRRSPGQRSTS